MRLLPCLAALVLATTTLTTQIASACGGGYEVARPAPRVMLVSTHAVDPFDASAPRRSFALLAKLGAAHSGAPWKKVVSNTHDSTRVRSLGRMPTRTLTLLGRHGTRVVSATRRVQLAGAFRHVSAVHDAVELPVREHEDFSIAIEGVLPKDAVWHAVQRTYSQTDKIFGTSLTATWEHHDGEARFTLRADQRELGTYRGSVMGALDLDGARYLVVSVDGQATTLEVPLT